MYLFHNQVISKHTFSVYIQRKDYYTKYIDIRTYTKQLSNVNYLNVNYINCRLSERRRKMLTQPKMATNQRKRTVLSVDQKFEICKRLKKGATITSLLKELNIGKLMICDIKRNEEKLVTFVEKLFFTSITSFFMTCSIFTVGGEVFVLQYYQLCIHFVHGVMLFDYTYFFILRTG